MPYGSDFGNTNPLTGLPILDRYPNAGADQGTQIPEGAGGAPKYPSGHQSDILNTGVNTADGVVKILSLEA